jgi:hypothetical protein
MPEDTCEELNCCPPGFAVPPLGGVLSIAGEDSVNNDPNIADGELVLAEEAEWVNGRIPSAGSTFITQYGIAPVPPLTVPDFQTVKVGYRVFAVAVCKTFTCTQGSPTIAVSSTVGVTVGNIVELVSDYFPYGTTVLSVSSPNVTLSNNALGSTPANPPYPIISFRPTTGPVLVSLGPDVPLIPANAVVDSIAGDFSSVELSVATNAPSSVTRIITAFYPAELDPNVTDEDELFT